MTKVAIDTWGFREILAHRPRGNHAGAVIAEADVAFTVRECVAETWAAIVRETRRSEIAWRWWNDLRETPIRVFEPPLDEVHAFVERSGPEIGLSLADWSLAYVAKRERTTAIVTEDAEFRRVGLDPLFAK